VRQLSHPSPEGIPASSLTKQLARRDPDPGRKAKAGEPVTESLARYSAMRLVAYIGTVAMGFVYAVVTARWLGPADKGVLATLMFLAVILSQFACLGLGEAAIVLVARKRASLQEATSAIMGALMITSLVAAMVLAVAAFANFSSDWNAVWAPIVVACAGVPAFAYLTVLAQIANVQERFFATSLLLFAQGAIAAVTCVALIIVWPLAVLGAVLATVLGAAGGSAAILWLLKRKDFSLRPSWNWRFLRLALSYGIKVQASGPPPITDRADLLLVYVLGGQAAAGRYSVALTVGTFVGMVPLAVSHVSFPRLARLSAEDAHALTVRTCRYSLGAAVTIAAGLLVAVPIALPIVFGHPYAPAVVPALILLAAYALSSAQWVLGRAAAARGNAGILAWSFGANLAVMIGLDYLFIPKLGISGAAIAAVLGASIGLIVSLLPYRTPGRTFASLTEFLPTASDFRDLAALPKLLAKGRSEATSTPTLLD
jgi:O-antigen/teichoic acid export membrane protein